MLYLLFVYLFFCVNNIYSAEKRKLAPVMLSAQTIKKSYLSLPLNQAQELIKYGAQVNYDIVVKKATNKKAQVTTSPLLLAIQKDKRDAVEFLLKNKADINYGSEETVQTIRTLLHQQPEIKALVEKYQQLSS